MLRPPSGPTVPRERWGLASASGRGSWHGGGFPALSFRGKDSTIQNTRGGPSKRPFRVEGTSFRTMYLLAQTFSLVSRSLGSWEAKVQEGDW